MRRPLAIVMLVLAGTFAALGGAPVARAATARTPAKVVIIVGATHGTTPTYRTYADAAYAEAIKYTPNVVKVYSPNATWSKVKAAAVGRVDRHLLRPRQRLAEPVHLRPASTRPRTASGLNADLNGDGKLSDYENKYYGEPYVATLDLAPNAIVLLHHLCYASGNSEPGKAAADGQRRPPAGRQLRRGLPRRPSAQAVIADGHAARADYIRALFTTDHDHRTAVAHRARTSTVT